MTLPFIVILFNRKYNKNGIKNCKNNFKKLNRNISYILAINKNK